MADNAATPGGTGGIGEMCADHPTVPSVAQCKRCHKNLCNTCVQRTSSGAAVCIGCYALEERGVKAPRSTKDTIFLILKVLLANLVAGVVVLILLGAIFYGLLYMICGKK